MRNAYRVVLLGCVMLCPCAVSGGLCAQGAGVAQPEAARESGATAQLREDVGGQRRELDRLAGRVDGMEEATVRAAAAGEKAAGAAEGTIATVRWCTSIISALIVVVGGTLGFLGYRELKGIQIVRKEAEEALKEAEEARSQLRGVVDDGKRDISRLISDGEGGLREMRSSVNELLERVQADAEQRIRAAEETARKSPTAQPLAEPLGRQERWALAQVLITTGNLARGAELLRRVAEDDLAANSPDINVLNQLSGILDQVGRYADAMKYADAAAARFPGDVGAPFNRAVIEIHLGGAAPDVEDKRRHWRTALGWFDKARRLHDEGTRMNDADYGKMWLFAGETAQFLAEVDPEGERRSDFLQKAAAWYNEGYKWLLEARGRTTEQTAPLIQFWADNAHARTLQVHYVDRRADEESLQRRDVARRRNSIPFWSDEDGTEQRGPAEDAPS